MKRSTLEPHDDGCLRGRRWTAALVAALALVFWAGVAPSGALGAGDDPAQETPPQETPAQAPAEVDLDRLLRLPTSYSEPSKRPGGSAADEWRERFREARSDLDGARTALATAQSELEATASDSGQWSVSAPGASNPENSPVSYRLRQEIRVQRENVEKYERNLRVLEIEADLKEVPLDWRS